MSVSLRIPENDQQLAVELLNIYKEAEEFYKQHIEKLGLISHGVGSLFDTRFSGSSESLTILPVGDQSWILISPCHLNVFGLYDLNPTNDTIIEQLTQHKRVYEDNDSCDIGERGAMLTGKELNKYIKRKLEVLTGAPFDVEQYDPYLIAVLCDHVTGFIGRNDTIDQLDTQHAYNVAMSLSQ